MNRTAAMATALTAGAVAAGVAVLPASGQDTPGTRTLTFTSTEKPRDQKQVDVKPRGTSIGDTFVFSSLLHKDGKIAGRVEGDCVAIDATYEGLQCNLVAILADGRLTLQGAAVNKKIPGVGGTDEHYVITGGSGAYVGAAGTMTRSGDGKNDALTFTLSG